MPSLGLEQWIAPAATVLAGLIVVVGGAITYQHQKSIDRKEQLIAKRREIYADLLVAISRSITERGTEANSAYHKAKSEIFVYGSDEVVAKVKPLAHLLEHGADSSGSQQLQAYAALVHAMRADSFESSKLSLEQLSKLTPYNTTDGEVR